MRQLAQMFLFATRIRLFGAWCFVLAFSAAACSPTPEAPLRIGSGVWPGYEPLFLARNLGFYKGTQVRLVELPSASDVIRALRSGVLEGAAITLDEVLVLVNDGFDLRIVLVLDSSDGADALLARPEIQSLAQLGGKRVAVENTLIGAVLLDGALDAAGLTRADIEVVDCSVETHISCYATVDAVVTYEPAKTELQHIGARVIFDSSQTPDRIVDVLVVHAAVADIQPNSIERLIKGYFQAREHLIAAPEDAARRMAGRLSLSPDEVLASFEGLNLPGLEANQTMLQGNTASLKQIAADLGEFMLERGFLSSRVAVQHLPDGRFLPGGSLR